MTDEQIAESVKNATLVIADLQKQRNALTANLGNLREQKAKAALGAFTGPPAAKQALRSLNTQIGDALLDIEDLDVALALAQGEVAEAQTASAALSERKKIDAVLARLADGRKTADQLQKHIRGLVEHVTALFDDLEAARSIGAPLPGRELVRVNLARSFQTEMMAVKLNTETIPPNQRHHLSDVIAAWIASAEHSLRMQRAQAESIIAKR
ncbi:MAG: hypothetical protein P4L57_08970 [Rhizomicrobium sp.]|nr:hypothetical protein [Rhizomicrobium sp.]